jgi:hypothetical protein
VNARRVHAVIAAGVQNPALIEAWRRDPELLRDLGLDPAQVDLDGLWKFAGLALKVRHNGIREDLPLTFRLLHVIELAVDVFASYAARRGDGRLGDTEARARDFVDFLEQWLDLALAPHVLLWDMVRHERAVAQLVRAAPSLGVVPARPRRGVPTDAPRLRDGLVFHAMSSDPRAVAMLLREKAPRLDEVALEPCCICYWRDGDEAAIARLDAWMHDLLSLVDGERTAAEIHGGLLRGDGPRSSAPDEPGAEIEAPAESDVPGFVHILDELAELGILALGPAR